MDHIHHIDLALPGVTVVETVLVNENTIDPDSHPLVSDGFNLRTCVVVAVGAKGNVPIQLYPCRPYTAHDGDGACVLFVRGVLVGMPNDPVVMACGNFRNNRVGIPDSLVSNGVAVVNQQRVEPWNGQLVTVGDNNVATTEYAHAVDGLDVFAAHQRVLFAIQSFPLRRADRLVEVCGVVHISKTKAGLGNRHIARTQQALAIEALDRLSADERVLFLVQGRLHDGCFSLSCSIGVLGKQRACCGIGSALARLDRETFRE